MAAGRYTSVLTTTTFLRSRSLSRRASFATVVVLPEPCRPAISTTAGGATVSANESFTAPINATSSSCTTLTSICPGDNDPITS